MNMNKKLHEFIRGNGILKFVDIGEGKGKLGGGILPVEKEKEFLQSMQKATVMLDDSRYIRMNSDKKDIDRIDYELDLEDGSRNPDTAEIKLKDQDPIFKLNELSAKKLMAKTRLTTEAIEDNIEQGSLESTITDLFGRAAGRSFERICIFGNTNLPSNENIPSGYRQIDGWIKKAGILLKDFENINIETILTKMYDTLNPSYLDSAKFYLPTYRVSQYRRALKSRHTTLGDEAVTKDNQLLFEGIPLIPVPALDYPIRNSFFWDNIAPETLFLGRPGNFVHGLKREITVKSKEEIENDLFKFVLSLRGDCHYEDETKTIIAQPILKTKEK